MEKFSTWRDASNGIAPFVLPVPTGDDTSGPLLLAARLFQTIFAVARFILFFVFVGTYSLLDNLVSLLLVRSQPETCFLRSEKLSCGVLTDTLAQHIPDSKCHLRHNVVATLSGNLFRLLLYYGRTSGVTKALDSCT